MISASEALARLREGNERFVADIHDRSRITETLRRNTVIEGQSPFAIILGCSDSRVPAEIVFDQGLGDLFVIRVAGNIAAPSQIGSIEFAAEQFGTKLVVVLGHSHCGAVQATLDELKRPAESRSPHLSAIVDRIRPALENIDTIDRSGDEHERMERAVRANIRATVDNLQHGSAILEQLIANNDLHVIGAEYCLKSGIVNFFDTPLA